MAIVPVTGLGSGGIIKDKAAVLLQPNQFSDGRNVRFDNDSVSKIKGHVQIQPNLTGATNPTFGIHWPRPTTRYNIYANPTTVSRIDQTGSISTISTGSTYSSGAKWHGSLFTGGYAVVMNNTVDTPQYIIYGTAGATQETTLVNLPGWNYGDITVTAGVVRPFRNHLVAGNLRDTQNSVVTENPGTIRISTAAAPGTVPATWEPGVGDELADEFELSQTEPITEMLQLRGNMVVYTGDSIHLISIGSTATIVNDYATGYGCLAIDCVAEFDGNHFVVDRNDIYAHNGSGKIQSVVDERMRDYFFGNLHQTHYANTFVVPNRAQDEIWVCYPTLTATNGDCNEALIWNYRKNTWSIRDLPNLRAGFQGPFVSSNAFQLANEKLVGVGRADSKFYAMDEGNTFDGTNFTAYVENKRIDLTGDDASSWVSDYYPVFDAGLTTSTAITISLRAQNNFTQDVSFTDNKGKVQVFNPQLIDRGYKVSPRTNGRLMNIRVESTDDAAWTLARYSLMVDKSNER